MNFELFGQLTTHIVRNLALLRGNRVVLVLDVGIGDEFSVRLLPQVLVDACELRSDEMLDEAFLLLWNDKFTILLIAVLLAGSLRFFLLFGLLCLHFVHIPFLFLTLFHGDEFKLDLTTKESWPVALHLSASLIIVAI